MRATPFTATKPPTVSGEKIILFLWVFARVTTHVLNNPTETVYVALELRAGRGRLDGNEAIFILSRRLSYPASEELFAVQNKVLHVVCGQEMQCHDITVRYNDVSNDRPDKHSEIREDVAGFAAVIFRHECDHLDGIIFTDKVL